MSSRAYPTHSTWTQSCQTPMVLRCGQKSTFASGSLSTVSEVLSSSSEELARTMIWFQIQVFFSKFTISRTLPFRSGESRILHVSCHDYVVVPRASGHRVIWEAVIVMIWLLGEPPANLSAWRFRVSELKPFISRFCSQVFACDSGNRASNMLTSSLSHPRKFTVNRVYFRE